MKHLVIFILVGTSLSFSSCFEKDSDHDGILDDKDKCPFVAAKTPDGCPVPKTINKVHLYLDNSASMGGYFVDSTAYKKTVSDLAVKINDEIAPVDISFIADKIVAYQKDVSHFPMEIATTHIADQNSSQLHLMIDQIASRTGGNDVSLMVSDCILSFPDADIRANKEINKTDADVVLKNNVYDTFVHLQKKGFGTSLYAFESRFTGRYYNYQNTPIRLKGAFRPYYIWVIAKKDILAIFETKLTDVSSFRPEQALHFGMADSPVNHYHILPQLGRTGQWKKIASPVASGDLGLEDIEANNKEPVAFNAVVNLSGLPAYARELSYLQQNLQLSSPGCHATFVIKQKGDVSPATIKSNEQRLSFESATHVVEVRVDDFRLPNTVIRLILPLKYDTWYTDWSCMDDKQVASQGHRTFAFNCLVDGLKQAFETRNKNYIELTFHLNK